MWNFLPLGQLHQTTNYGCAGGVCTGRYHNIYHAQAKRALEVIEAELTRLLEADPGMYYEGDFDVLLDRHRVMTERLKGPFS